ncbi:cupin domain-containing protein [Endothiovibrio diazotrophicus]
MNDLLPKSIVTFPGGYVQIFNPRYPIRKVWSDVLHLDPRSVLPAHIHAETSSLLICINGAGEIGVDGNKVLLKKGSCVFIPARSVHYVKSSETQSLECISINEGIIRPGNGTDLQFLDDGGQEKEGWDDFSNTCSLRSKELQSYLMNYSGLFAFDLKLEE